MAANVAEGVDPYALDVVNVLIQKGAHMKRERDMLLKALTRYATDTEIQIIYLDGLIKMPLADELAEIRGVA